MTDLLDSTDLLTAFRALAPADQELVLQLAQRLKETQREGQGT